MAELLQALEGDIAELLDIQESIKNVCSGFVVIDNGGNVSMVHQTAREYLLGDAERPFHVDRSQAHEQLFLSCMQCLMSNGLRSKVSQELPDFVRYSAKWWSSHLASVSPDSESVVRVMTKFLSGHWVLTWIQILATQRRLRVLVQASKHLVAYATKRKRRTATGIGKAEIVEQELLESWAIDLTKVVGKFGAILRRNPTSIYKTIPPFCPHSSAIYQQFGKAEQRALMVSESSRQVWDDSLARLSFGFGTFASSISAAGSQIAVLASSGNISLYDSSVFEEMPASPILHGERVYRMKLSTSGTLLVTYGYKTTKVWETITGKRMLTVPNVPSRPRPLVMLLTNNNSTLLVGSDDKVLRSLNLNESSPSWQIVTEFNEEELEGHFLNAASQMTLSSDGSLMAVAYRGHPLSAWEVDGPYHIGHCWRAREEVARGEVVEAMWHPHSPEILGLYIEGVIFKWNPYGGEPEELSTGASRLAMSGDGALFATGDVRGSVKVYATNDFKLLYQIASQDSVLGLSFSVDQHRLYDVRGYYANTWEPTALARYTEGPANGTDPESESEHYSQYSIAPLRTAQRIDAITALAASPKGRLYCFGTEGGRVRLIDMKEGEGFDLHVSKGFLSIEQLVWSDDGRYLCYADSSKKIIVFSVDTSTSSPEGIAKRHCKLMLKAQTEGPIQQVFFHPDSSHLFVATSSTLCTVSMHSASVTRSVSLAGQPRKWVIHPQDPALILGFVPESVKLVSWNLKDQGIYPIAAVHNQDAQAGHDDATITNIVERIITTSDKRHLLMQMSGGGNAKEKRLLYFATSSFSISNLEPSEDQHGSAEQQTINPVCLPQQASSRISIALSFLKRDRLVFLSRNFSVCSLDIQAAIAGSSPNKVANIESYTSNKVMSFAGNLPPPRREESVAHVAAEKGFNEMFSLPMDWISRDLLELCTLWLQEKSLLCPRNGEVAVVRCSSFI